MIWHKNYCCCNLKIPCLANNTYSKSVVETVKGNSRDCASLSTTCSMSKTLFKCFLVYYQHVFVYCDVFAVTIFFSMSLLPILNRFHTLIYFYLLSVLYWVQKKPQRCSLKKVFSKITQYLQENVCVGSFFNRVIGLQAWNYIKRRLLHRFFLRNMQKFLKTPFLKNICERLLL